MPKIHTDQPDSPTFSKAELLLFSCLASYFIAVGRFEHHAYQFGWNFIHPRVPAFMPLSRGGIMDNLTAQYKVSKSILGKTNVIYQCPRCLTELISPLDDAGQTDTCPKCRHYVFVPGVREKAEATIQKQQKEAEAQELIKRKEQEQEDKRQQAKLDELAKAQAEVENIPAYHAIKTLGTTCMFLGYISLALYAVSILGIFVGFSYLTAIGSNILGLTFPQLLLILGAASVLVMFELVALFAGAQILFCVRDIARNSYRSVQYIKLLPIPRPPLKPVTKILEPKSSNNNASNATLSTYSNSIVQSD
ncbi:hypothetical protein JD969_02365 [Planctomycetota bacterium]|nr:hypothetical protein JD969_02365 [Planctomycetota bacterium]